MCLSTPSMPAPTPVAPIAPLEPPRPMGLADDPSAMSARKGIGQLRIASKAAEGPAQAMAGMSGPSTMTLKDRKETIDKRLAQAGG